LFALDSRDTLAVTPKE